MAMGTTLQASRIVKQNVSTREGNLYFLASQDALEVMSVTYLLTESLIVSIDFTDVTLVSGDA